MRKFPIVLAGLFAAGSVWACPGDSVRDAAADPAKASHAQHAAAQTKKATPVAKAAKADTTKVAAQAKKPAGG